MKIIKNQRLAGTRLDLQGERIPKEVLVSFCETYAGKRMLLNQEHDLSLPSIGFVENLQVVVDEESPGDWVIVGDVYLEGESIKTFTSGFSISFLETILRSQDHTRFCIYLPFPYYKDKQLLDELYNDGHITVGRWAKKGADPEAVALTVSVIVFFIKPVWEDFYKTQIAPQIYFFFSNFFKKLRKKSISTDFIQPIVFNGHEIHVMFIPVRGNEEHCFTVKATSQAMALVYSHLISQAPLDPPASKIFLLFDKQSDAYKIHRIEFNDGAIKEF